MYRSKQFEAAMSQSDAAAENDAAAAIAFAASAVDRTRVAILDAIDAGTDARQQAAAARPA